MAQHTAFSLRAGFTIEDDVAAANALARYCRGMGIQMQTVQYDNHIVMNFFGREDNLLELRTHLEGVRDNHAG